MDFVVGLAFYGHKLFDFLSIYKWSFYNCGFTTDLQLPETKKTRSTQPSYNQTMGQSCDCTKQSAPDKKPERRRTISKPRRIETDYASSSSDDSDEYDSEKLLPNVTVSESGYESEAKEKAIAGFKEAVFKGTESLVIYYVDEFPDLDLLSLPFENGDNCLHVAVRNSSYNLIYYLLTHGISVNYI